MKSVAKTLAAILLAPIGIALGMLVFGTLGIIAIPFSIRGHFEHRKWLHAMRSSGRTRTAAEILAGNESGTLIVDQPGWGGKAKYCWWTPDDIESLAPIEITPLKDRIEAMKSEITFDSLPLDRWIYDRYLSSANGTAYLVAIRRGDNVAALLQADLDDLRLIETWSGPFGEFGTLEMPKAD